MSQYFFHSKSKIIPSVNTLDINEFEKRVNWCNIHTERIHLDVSDGIFTKSKTLTLSQMMSAEFKSWIDVHLMVEDPLEMLRRQPHLIKINRAYFHKNSKSVPLDFINFCRSRKIKVGIGLSVNESVDSIRNYLSEAESILLLTVELGITGGKFQPEALNKAAHIRKLGYGGKIIIDGAINKNSLKEALKVHPDNIISGNYIFTGDPDERYLEMDILAESAH